MELAGVSTWPEAPMDAARRNESVLTFMSHHQPELLPSVETPRCGDEIILGHHRAEGLRVIILSHAAIIVVRQEDTDAFTSSFV